MRLRHWLLLTVAALASSLAAAGPAAGSIDGPCSATIAGTNVGELSGTAAGDAIRVQHNAQVPVTMGSASGISHLKVVISMAGFDWTVKNEPASGSSWARTVDVGAYAKWGVGLYQVTGVSQAAGGTQCSGTALVRVEGNPLTSVAGGVGLALGIVGALGLLAAAWRPGGHLTRATFTGLVSGLVLAVGVGTLLQQFSLVYPTRGIAVATLLAGLGVGVVLPFVVQTVSTGNFGPRHHHPAAGH